MSDLFPKILTGKNHRDLLILFAERDFRDPIGHPLHLSLEFLELVDMALNAATHIAEIKKDISALRNMLEASKSEPSARQSPDKEVSL